MSDTDRITSLEEQISYLTRTVDELSDVIARQENDIDKIHRRLGMLMEAEVSRQSDGEGSIALADQRPPHW
ncbi:SlyX family protein [Celeribacter marinus]|uniref:SlyX family protein n=1 Tax=Celeribacter marinus TaxID=1397108 RepID=UPI003F6C4B0E